MIDIKIHNPKIILKIFYDKIKLKLYNLYLLYMKHFYF